MGALSMLLRDPTALPYLLQVKARVRHALGSHTARLARRAVQRSWLTRAAGRGAPRSAGIPRRASCRRTSRSRFAMVRAAGVGRGPGRAAYARARVRFRCAQPRVAELRDRHPAARPRAAGCGVCAASRVCASRAPDACRPGQVCVFYLVLRGLDTVEDDMSIPEARGKARVAHAAAPLTRLCLAGRQDPGTAGLPQVHLRPQVLGGAWRRAWHAARGRLTPCRPRQECGPATKGHYKELMNKFPLVSCWRSCSACLRAA